MGLIVGMVVVAFAALYVWVSREQSKLRQAAEISLRHGRPVLPR